MAYKVSYKVISEQGDQLKKTAKEMENYINQMNQIISKLGNDQLMQSVRSDLKKFNQQLETEKQVLNMAGQILSDVVQSYSSTEKKSVAKVDKAKAHNRDFYKRPVAVASAGSTATASATATATAYASGGGSATVVNQTVVNNTYIVNEAPVADAMAGASGPSGAGIFTDSVLQGAGEVAGMAGAVGLAAAAGGVAAAAINEKRQERKSGKEAVEAT
jgi:hypothetical protein